VISYGISSTVFKKVTDASVPIGIPSTVISTVIPPPAAFALLSALPGNIAVIMNTTTKTKI
jgi:hypothetical protein